MVLAFVAAPAEVPPPQSGAPESATSTFSTQGAIDKAQAASILSKCDDRRFEASAEGMIDGSMKRRRITLCAELGDSDAQWIERLEKAVLWVGAQASLSAEVKAQLVADLQGEIGRLKSPQAAAGLATLKPAPLMPAPVVPQPVRPSISPAPGWEVSALPPMPAPITPPPPSLLKPGATQAALLTPSVNAPRVDLLCTHAGEPSGTPCTRISPDTGLLIRAASNVPSGLTLRFLRKGSDIGADVVLGGLRSGKDVRVKLPQRLCSGVVRSEATIQVLTRGPAAGELAAVVGPVGLRC